MKAKAILYFSAWGLSWLLPFALLWLAYLAWKPRHRKTALTLGVLMLLTALVGWHSGLGNNDPSNELNLMLAKGTAVGAALCYAAWRLLRFIHSYIKMRRLN